MQACPELPILNFWGIWFQKFLRHTKVWKPSELKYFTDIISFEIHYNPERWFYVSDFIERKGKTTEWFVYGQTVIGGKEPYFHLLPLNLMLFLRLCCWHWNRLISKICRRYARRWPMVPYNLGSQENVLSFGNTLY